MTLALYGKSRKRQGSLLLAALMAILVAAIGGVAMIGTAFAHHNTIAATRQCNDSWTGSASYVGGDSRKLIVISDVVINGANYATSWSTDTGDGSPFGDDPIAAYSLTAADFWDNEQPTGTSMFMWDDTDDGFSIYNRSGGAATFDSNWSGTIKLYGRDQRWVQVNGNWTQVTKWNLEDTDTVTPPSRPTNCDGKVIIGKYVPDGISTSTVFTADVKNTDTDALLHDDTTFSETSYKTLTFVNASNLNLTITENALAGYNFTGVKVVSGGDVDCRYQTYSAPGSASVTDLDAGETFTVCFKNEEKPTRKLEICKQVIDNGDATNNGGAFSIKVEGETDVDKTVYENETGSSNPDCSTRDVVDGEAIDISEVTPGASAAWPGNAAGWPKYNIDGGSFTSLGSGITIVVGDDTCGLQQEEQLTRGTEDLERNIEETVIAPDCKIIIQNKASLNTRNVQVCKVVVGNGDADVHAAFGYGFDIRPTGLGNISDSNSVAEPAGADGTESAEICKTKSVPADKAFDVVEWSSRPADAGGWQDASGYPKYSINGGARISNNTTTQIAAGTSDVKVTFFNKEGRVSVVKTNTGNGTWDIVFTNSTSQTVQVDFSDTYEPNGTNTNINSILSGGSNVAGCTPASSPTPMNVLSVQGCDLSIPAGESKTVVVNTDPLGAKCEDQRVVNTVTAYRNGTPVDGSPSSDDFFLQGDPALCTRDIQICKVWNTSTGETPNPVAKSFQFQVDSESVQIDNVFEDVPNDLNCKTVTVQRNSTVDISELIGAGWDTWYKVNNGPEVAGTALSLYVGSESCYEAQESDVLREVSGLVRGILNILEDSQIVQPFCRVTFINEDPGQTLPNGNLLIQKFIDLNGDGDANDAGEYEYFGWGMTTNGPGLANDHKLTVDEVAFNGVLYLGLESGDVYQVTEDGKPGFVVTNVRVNGISQGASTTAFGTIGNGTTTIIQFFNRPLGSIKVQKVAVTSNNGGPEVAAPQDDDGWTITVSSGQCNVIQQKQTDENGYAEFTNLPYCSDYVVSENPVNAGSPGFTVVGSASVTGQSPNGQTITFKNKKTTSEPQCTDATCRTISTPTPVTPTPTTPSATPTKEPETPTPTSTVRGERTPGPGASATPIAPSTGGGLIGGTSGGMNILLIVAGLLALTSGLSFVALGRKNRR